MGKTNFILIRHGESLGNAAKVILGHTDMDLSDQGYLQAKTTAEHLKDYNIDKIYASDLLRAYNTALPHAKMRNLEINTSKKLREIYVGEWENHSVADIRQKYGNMYDVDWGLGFGTFRFPAGESTIEAGKRFYAEMKRIAEENPGKTVLVAAHAAVIRAFWSIITNIEPENIAKELPFPTNASYSLLSYEKSQFLPEAYSCDSHLEAVGITGKTGVSH